MNKIKALLKGSPVIMLVAGLLVAGAVSAAFLTVYTTMNGAGDVDQAVVFGNDDDAKVYTFDGIAGNTYTQDYNLKNRSETTAPIKFLTSQCIVGGGNCGASEYNEDGVDTSYWSTLGLSTKDASWKVTDDGGKATLTYKLVGPEFEYEFEASGLIANEPYSLIYYADRQDRWNDFGGDNPGALIATFTTTDVDGNDPGGDIVKITGSEDIGMNLPHADDWNGSADANYCTNDERDDYNLCRGAKIWLVPSSDYVNGVVTWTNMSDYLYETDLITYDKFNPGTGLEEALYLGEGTLNFFVKNVLDVALKPGEYQVKTEIQPVTIH